MRLGRMASVAAALSAVCAAGAWGAPAGALPAWAEPDLIEVIFREGTGVRLREGALTDGGTGALREARATLADVGAKGAWARAHDRSEEALEELRARAAARGGRAPDLNLSYRFRVADAADTPGVIEALAGLACVAHVAPAPRPPEPPTPPNIEPDQRYLNAATVGLGAKPAWLRAGGDGALVRIADIEYSWNLAHQDLPTITHLGPAGFDPFNNAHHGTAAMGEILSKRNGLGTTGAAYNATGYVAAVHTGGSWNVPSAITTALGTLGPGDVLLIEQQVQGPNWTGVPPGSQAGMVPVEWNRPIYDAIVLAVGLGVVVVEAAGNGAQNLDSAVYGTGNNGHYPFQPANDSGAIIVGAGGSLFAGSGDRARLASSNYGATVDLQGWGDSVATTGYGDAYSAEGVNLFYTLFFSGTSSASAMVAGACAQTLSAYEMARGTALTPAALRSVLRATGSAQTSGTFPASQNIGPRPDADAAIVTALACAAPMVTDHPDAVNATQGQPAMLQVVASGTGLAYRWRRNATALNDGGGFSGVFTATLSIAGVTPANVGTYDVLVTNACGEDLSEGALVRIAGCTGDVNIDGEVNFLDLNIVLGQYGQSGAGLPGDINHDGVVDFVDLNLLLGLYGTTC